MIWEKYKCIYIFGLKLYITWTQSLERWLYELNCLPRLGAAQIQKVLMWVDMISHSLLFWAFFLKKNGEPIVGQFIYEILV